MYTVYILYIYALTYTQVCIHVLYIYTVYTYYMMYMHGTPMSTCQGYLQCFERFFCFRGEPCKASDGSTSTAGGSAPTAMIFALSTQNSSEFYRYVLYESILHACRIYNITRKYTPNTSNCRFITYHRSNTLCTNYKI